MPTLRQAVEQLYRTAVIDKSATSTMRLDTLATYGVQQLEKRGFKGAQVDVNLPGGARTKKWDVVWFHNGKHRLAISLKSLLKNLGGTVPNRIDDLIGEVTNLQMFSPEVVVGYLMLFDTSEDTQDTKHGGSWCDVLTRRLQSLSGRGMPAWGTGMVEAACVVRLDFSKGPKILTSETELMGFFDVLATEVLKRNPSAGRKKQ
ncbi:MAG TPA: PaeR7I family type II restriction endonuclease [Candidatus Xenobia bacterium]|nr:PaeR7I family type II restriction endonuclease [Candidatus Xenobia bacterium]